MEYKIIAAKVANASDAIYSHLSEKGKIKELKKEYLADIKSDYLDEKEDYKSFREYLDYNGEEYINFAFGTYIERLIPLLSDITEKDINALKPEEKEELLKPFIDYFIAKSKITVRRWFFEKVVTIIRE